MIMMDWKKGCLVVGLFFVLGMFARCEAKSVFAVSSHATSMIKAYSIDPADGTVELQATIQGTESFGYGATGLCVWPSIERLFVTYENDARIAWASTKSMKRDTYDKIYAPESNLAGVIADETNEVLYTIGRYSGNLYTYEFDTENDTLVLTYPNGQSYRTLEGLGNAYGIALDEYGGEVYFGSPSGVLYVADGTSTVRCYSTLNWELVHSYNLEMNAIGIDVDGDGHLYAGGHLSHNYLIRYKLDGDINDPETVIKKNMGYSITDIIIDKTNPEILYTTTRQNVIVNGNTYAGAVEVFDVLDPNNVVQIDEESDSDFVGPAGIGVGAEFKPVNGMSIKKVDDIDESTEEVLPGDYVTYDIEFGPGEEDETNVSIVDKLPAGVDFDSAVPSTGTYYQRPVHEYVWDIGDVDVGDPNSYFELKVQVNNSSEPKGELENIVEAESDSSFVDYTEYTPVGWWGGNVIYVDADAPGPRTGTSWETAYRYLYDEYRSNALDRAAAADDPTIFDLLEVRVAEGTYRPGQKADDTFELRDDLEVYGGYAGYGAVDPDERDRQKYKSVLSGLIRGSLRNNTVVTMGDDSLLDGVVVEEGSLYGIYGAGDDFIVTNCYILNNSQRGVHCEDGDLTIQWCEIENNGYQGINHEGNSYLLTVKNCRIHNNEYDGILTDYSTSEILNTVISANGSTGNYYGINLKNPSSSPDIRNNTIVDNVNEGIRFVGSNVPDVLNCILYYNNDGGSQISGFDEDSYASYCAIEGCNEVNNNINDDPDFVYDSEPYGYYHIKYDSDCHNGGDENTVVGENEEDIDGEPRIANDSEDKIDIGADEVNCEDTDHAEDWTYDGIVDLGELAMFSTAWLSHDPNDTAVTTDPNFIGNPNYVYADPNTFARWVADWNPVCDFDDDLDVDLLDFAAFSVAWNWEACWHENYSEVMYAMGGESMMMAVPASMTTSALQPQAVEEKSVAEQILELEDCIEFLEMIWLEDAFVQQEIEADDWEDFMDSVAGNLKDLEKVKTSKDK